MSNMWRDRADGDMHRDMSRIQFTEHIIPVIRETVTQHVNYEPYMGDFDVFMHHAINNLASGYVMGIVRRVPAKEFEKVVSFEVPATWWQHFKESHYPKWALKKFPVKYRTLTETIGFKALYDDIIPGKNPAIQVRVAEHKWE
ncbi:hypothetical protein JL_173 [Bacillus phage JL]|uniref:Uncharacterized protein n=1 Tax=Bacillus phage JL TaxID=1296655 RepID=S5MSS0_9CAUD|nr:hypothetical protein AVV47_gp123 [Bacillus phage JL]AGR46842.1 hypothetical protein JL_173 [Bacillus phage JL]